MSRAPNSRFRLRRSLIPRLVAAILLFSGAATLLATGIQLFVEYREDVGEIHQRIQAVRRGSLAPITTALWIFNEELVRQHLHGIIQMQDITLAQVRRGDGPVVAAGSPPRDDANLSADFPLIHVHDGEKRRLGHLHIAADLSGVHQRLKRRLLVILATQGVKTLFVSAFLFFLFHFLVTRHLRTLADYLGAVSPSRSFEPLRLDRGRLDRTPGDELDQVVEALNTMLWLLTLRREDLEKRVAARTAELDFANQDLRRKIEALERAEAALRESEERFTAFMAHTPMLAFIKDEMGRHIYANAGFERRYGFRRADWEGRLDFDLFPLRTAVNFRQNDVRVRRRQEPLDFEETFVRPDGTREFWVTYKFPILSPDGRRYLGGIALDFTEKRLLEIELMHARKRETVEVLAGGLAHDFNNLLTVILGNVELVKSDLAPGTRNFRFLAEAEAACIRSQRLTDLLITFAKGGQPHLLPGDLAATVREAVTAATAGSSVRVELHLSADLWPVEFDPNGLRDVFTHLAVNAREAMPNGGTLRISAQNVSSCRAEPSPGARLPQGPCVYLGFEDTGPGIPPDRIDQIFDPYFSTKERGGERGMGMGLAVVSAVVRKHGGHIAVTSTPGRGAAFHLHFPAAAKPPAEAEPPTTGAARRDRGRRILVMDDEEMVRRMLAQMLDRLDFETETVPDGQAAVQAYRAAAEAGKPFAVVILDLTVRGGPEGLAAIRELRAFDPEVVGVVSSGYSDDPAMADPERHGFRAGIPKPYTMETLREVLGRLVAVAPPPDA